MVVNYVNRIRECYMFIIGRRPELMPLVDYRTVAEIQRRVPGLCPEDFNYLHKRYERRELFPAIEDAATRDTLWQNLLKINYIIPSLYTFFQDIDYLKPLCNAMKLLLGNALSINQTLKENFKGNDRNEVVLQVSEDRFEKHVGDQESQLELGTVQLWLFAARNWTMLVSECPKKENGMPLPLPQKPDVNVWACFARLAEELGFVSDKICQYAGKPYSRTLPQKGSDVQEITGQEISRRCGRVYQSAYEQERDHLFVHKLQALKWEGQLCITSLFIRSSVLRAFFGGYPSIGSLIGSYVPSYIALATSNEEEPHSPGMVDGHLKNANVNETETTKLVASNEAEIERVQVLLRQSDGRLKATEAQLAAQTLELEKTRRELAEEKNHKREERVGSQSTKALQNSTQRVDGKGGTEHDLTTAEQPGTQNIEVVRLKKALEQSQSLCESQREELERTQVALTEARNKQPRKRKCDHTGAPEVKRPRSEDVSSDDDITKTDAEQRDAASRGVNDHLPTPSPNEAALRRAIKGLEDHVEEKEKVNESLMKTLTKLTTQLKDKETMIRETLSLLQSRDKDIRGLREGKVTLESEVSRLQGAQALFLQTITAIADDQLETSNVEAACSQLKDSYRLIRNGPEILCCFVNGDTTQEIRSRKQEAEMIQEAKRYVEGGYLIFDTNKQGLLPENVFEVVKNGTNKLIFERRVPGGSLTAEHSTS
ncbi:hypothetical protein EIK77_010852 [Talaromyces pinophilus]|nr:hypothetical protein EIK77_005449 [Talaromyces pinophilus]KAI7974031.1 hypothetical protein EIK77_010852 [Talaromyces pinophilus]